MMDLTVHYFLNYTTILVSAETLRALIKASIVVE